MSPIARWQLQRKELWRLLDKLLLVPTVSIHLGGTFHLPLHIVLRYHALFVGDCGVEGLADPAEGQHAAGHIAAACTVTCPSY